VSFRAVIVHAVAIPLLLTVSGPQVEQVKEYHKPELTVRVFPPIQVVDIAHGCSAVLLTAEIRGPEDERWYCPRVTWEKPDETKAIEESDCPPFAERYDCYPKLPEKCQPGWHRNRDGKILDNEEQSGCECNVVGYPRRWSISLCAPAHPQGEAWEVWARLEGGGKTVARQPVRFWVK
jgi:hypothetical protein